MALCGKCGAELKDGVTFCGKCGAPLEGAPSASAVDNSAGDTADSKGGLKDDNFVIKGDEEVTPFGMKKAPLLKEFSLQDGVVTITTLKGTQISFKLGTYSVTYIINPKQKFFRYYHLKNESGKVVFLFTIYTYAVKEEAYEKMESALGAKEAASSKALGIVKILMPILMVVIFTIWKTCDDKPQPNNTDSAQSAVSTDSFTDSRDDESTGSAQTAAPTQESNTGSGQSAGSSDNSKSFTDSRDGKTYKKVTIGKQVWMAENLNYAAKNSVCYENKEANCAKYGRLYNWKIAMTVCPAGWHLPTSAEWGTLENAVGDSEMAGTKLKSKSGWEENGNGTDDFGFSALPSGLGFSEGSFDGAAFSGDWWSATERDANIAIDQRMYYNLEFVNEAINDKAYLLSVRCVQDVNTGSASSGSVSEYVRKGMKYLESGDNNRRSSDYDLAVAEFDKAIRLSPNNAEAYYGRGRAYLRKGDNNRAVADYTEAIRLNPNDAISYSNRGRAYARLGDYDNAVSDFESALRIDPNNAAIKQNLEKARRHEKGL